MPGKKRTRERFCSVRANHAQFRTKLKYNIVDGEKYLSRKRSFKLSIWVVVLCGPYCCTFPITVPSTAKKEYISIYWIYCHNATW